MVGLAEGLGVVVIEEQFSVPTVRHDVVNDTARRHPVLCLTHPAEGLIP